MSGRKFPLDLSKFKKDKSNKHCTILRHPSGHTIKIAHKGLSPKLKAQLDALDRHQKQIGKEPSRMQKFAEGGQVENEELIIEPAPPSELPRQYQPLDIEEEKPLQIEPVREIPQGAAGPGALLERPAQPAPQMNPYVDAYNSAYERWKSANPGSSEDVARQQGYAAVERLKNIEQAQKDSSEAEAKAREVENKRRVQLGLPPLPGAPAEGASMTAFSRMAPQDSAQPMSEVDTAAMANVAAEPQQPADSMQMPDAMRGYQMQMQGIQEQANAERELARTQEKLYNNQVKEQQGQLQLFQSNLNELNKERQALIKDLNSKGVDPDRYWQNHSKVQAMIGMILGGFSTQAGPNKAMELIQQELNKDLRAQEVDINKQNNLLAANMQQYGNMRDAMAMTRSMQNDLMADQLKAAAAKANDPMVQARAMQMAGQLEQQASQLTARVAVNRSLSTLMEDAKNNPASAPALINAMRAVDPKRAEELEKTFVPGIGFAPTPDDAKIAKESVIRRDTIKQNLRDLQAMIQRQGTYETFGSHNADLNRKVDQIATDMAKLQDPNSVARPGEVELVKQGLVESGIFKRDATAIQTLKNFSKEVDNRVATVLQQHGLSVPSPIAKLPPAQQAYAKWAMQNINNPEHSQKARLVLNKLGLE